MRTAEEAVLVAALDGDEAEVRRRLSDFLPGEKKALVRAFALIERVGGLKPDPMEVVHDAMEGWDRA